MKPKKSKQKRRQKDLFRSERTNMIDPGHGLVKLARAVNWDRMDEVFGRTFCPDPGSPRHPYTFDDFASLPQIHSQS
jgi:IS5 family transposase